MTIAKLNTDSNYKILIAGASGFVGGYLSKFLESHGFEIYKLVRRKPQNDFEIEWDPSKQFIDTNKLNNSKISCVINLSGASLSKNLRWTKNVKNEIYTSRINTTKFLSEIFKDKKLDLFISTSAIGIYGSQIEKAYENSSFDGDFLSKVCQDWEKSVVVNSQTRVVFTRFGIVMGNGGGILKELTKTKFLKFLAILGNGKNKISWISLYDLSRAILFIIQNEKIEGAVNLVNPYTITQEALIKSLKNYYKCYFTVKIPKLFLYLIFGKEKTNVFLLSSQKVVPQKLLNFSFNWEDTKIEDAIKRDF
ncbi:MAG: epimerase [Candidatus Dojkabacteria bacterium]|nr:MAG: epimerase [Candidatus Dojkabacteria bacterium]